VKRATGQTGCWVSFKVRVLLFDNFYDGIVKTCTEAVSKWGFNGQDGKKCHSAHDLIGRKLVENVAPVARMQRRKWTKVW